MARNSPQKIASVKYLNKNILLFLGGSLFYCNVKLFLGDPLLCFDNFGWAIPFFAQPTNVVKILRMFPVYPKMLLAISGFLFFLAPYTTFIILHVLPTRVDCYDKKHGVCLRVVPQGWLYDILPPMLTTLRVFAEQWLFGHLE